MHRYVIVLLALLCCIALASPSTYAGVIGGVGGAKVKKGASSVEARIGYTDDNENPAQENRLQARIHADYAFTDLYAARLVIGGDKRDGNNFEHSAITFENRFHILKAVDHGFDFGIRTMYNHLDGDKKPNTAQLIFYQEGQITDQYYLTLNQFFTHDVGEDASDGISPELRFQLMHSISSAHALGVEGFHKVGNLTAMSGYSAQNHTIGPVMKGKVSDTLKYEAGYRAGISDAAPDHSLKVFINRAF